MCVCVCVCDVNEMYHNMCVCVCVCDMNEICDNMCVCVCDVRERFDERELTCSEDDKNVLERSERVDVLPSRNNPKMTL